MVDDTTLDEPHHGCMGRVVEEGNRRSRRDVDGRVFEDHGPFVGVVDAFAGIGGVVGIPVTDRRLGKVNDEVGGGREDAIRAVAGDDELGLSWLEASGQSERGECEGAFCIHFVAVGVGLIVEIL